ncbi:hypothetical protein BDZ89DRAFT_1062382 [Hymenopellis radicata]|nr:hypothetical protein BDZ89DRAFT_1062382 [Hymenopellis radicata]
MSDRTELAIRALAPHLFVGSARQQADLRRKQLAIVMPDHKKENTPSTPRSQTGQFFDALSRVIQRSLPSAKPLGSHYVQNLCCPIEKDVYALWMVKFEALALKFDEANQKLAALPPEAQEKAKLVVQTQLEGVVNDLADFGEFLKNLPCFDD